MTAKPPKSKNWLILTLVLLGLGLAFFLFTNKPTRPVAENQQTSAPTQSPLSSTSTSSKTGWKKYTNHLALFSVEYPDNLVVSDELLQDGKDGAPVQGSVDFCTKPIDPNVHFCEEGLNIKYGVPISDGWGGGCDEEDHKEIVFLGKTERICQGKDYMNQIHADHPQKKSVVNISAYLGSDFTSLEANQALDSFVFTSN